MKKEKIWQMALASGLCDADVSNDHQICTDYGDATEAVEKFAAMISAAEREACAKTCEEIDDRCHECLAHNEHEQCDVPRAEQYAAAIRARSNG